MIHFLPYRAQTKLLIWRNMMTFFRLNWTYRFKHWIFQWKQDEEGDIAFVVFNRLAFVKYKEHTIVNLKGKNMRKADKWQGYEQDNRIKPPNDIDRALDMVESMVNQHRS